MTNKSYPVWKRTEDVIGSIAGLIFFMPFAPIIALVIKLEYPSEPVLVKLKRVSGGRQINVYKFRNMVPGADKMKPGLLHLNERTDGPFFKINKDPRVTRVGRFLRKFRIDEFPQLLNVLKGELSLVGPRPHEPGEVDKYPAEFAHVPRARAGATGLSQVSGASSLPFLKELKLDSSYLKNKSLFGDIKIILKTVFILFSDPTAV